MDETVKRRTMPILLSAAYVRGLVGRGAWLVAWKANTGSLLGRCTAWGNRQITLIYLRLNSHRNVAPQDRATHFETLTDIFFCSPSLGGSTGFSTVITQIMKVVFLESRPLNHYT